MAKKKSKKAQKTFISSILCLVFAVLIIVSAVLPYLTSTGAVTKNSSSVNGFDIFGNMFGDSKDGLDAFESIFGTQEILTLNKLAGISAIVAVCIGGLAVIVALLTLLLKKKSLKKVNTLLGILAVLVSIATIIVVSMIASKTTSSIIAVTISFAPFVMLVGGLGLTVGSLIKR